MHMISISTKRAFRWYSSFRQLLAAKSHRHKKQFPISNRYITHFIKNYCLLTKWSKREKNCTTQYITLLEISFTTITYSASGALILRVVTSKNHSLSELFIMYQDFIDFKDFKGIWNELYDWFSHLSRRGSWEVIENFDHSKRNFHLYILKAKLTAAELKRKKGKKTSILMFLVEDVENLCSHRIV